MSLAAHRYLATLFDRKDFDLDPVGRMFLEVLADHANNETGVASCGATRIARWMGLKEPRSVRAIRERVVATGVIGFIPSAGGSDRATNRYTFPVQAFVAGTPGTPESLSTAPRSPTRGNERDPALTNALPRAGERGHPALVSAHIHRDEPGMNRAPGAVDDDLFRCIHPGCLLRVDPKKHRARCEEHDVRRRAEG